MTPVTAVVALVVALVALVVVVRYLDFDMQFREVRSPVEFLYWFVDVKVTFAGLVLYEWEFRSRDGFNWRNTHSGREATFLSSSLASELDLWRTERDDGL